MLLKINNLNKTYKSQHVLKDFSLTLNPKEYLGIAGPSGCGKTTLAKCIVGLETPDSGDIFFQDKFINEINKKDIQMIFQNPVSSLNPRMTIVQNMFEAYRIYFDKSKKNAKEIILRHFNDVNLDENILYRHPHELSGGQCQRVMIARALMLCPKLLIADEPTASLDILTTLKIADLLKSLREKYSLSLIFISHDISLINYICDRKINMI